MAAVSYRNFLKRHPDALNEKTWHKGAGKGGTCVPSLSVFNHCKVGDRGGHSEVLAGAREQRRVTWSHAARYGVRRQRITKIRGIRARQCHRRRCGDLI